MIKFVEQGSIDYDYNAIDMDGRQRSVLPGGFERLSDAFLPGVTRILAGRLFCWVLLHGEGIGQDESGSRSAAKHGCLKTRLIYLSFYKVVCWLYPGRSRPGLIEANYNSDSSSSDSSISGAFAPRPH